MFMSKKSRKLFECERAFTSVVRFTAMLRRIRSYYTTTASGVILEHNANVNVNVYMEPRLFLCSGVVKVLGINAKKALSV